MTTKYAAARDTAYQWRAEFRKARQENRSLRKVYAAAKALMDRMPEDELTKHLRAALRNAVFAQPE